MREEVTSKFRQEVVQHQQETIQLLEELKIEEDRSMLIVILVHLAGRIAEDYLAVEIDTEELGGFLTCSFVSSIVYCNEQLRELVRRGLGEVPLKFATILELFSQASSEIEKVEQVHDERTACWQSTLEQGIAFLQAKTFSQFSGFNMKAEIG